MKKRRRVADDLIEESQRLREDLLRTAAKLEVFADELATEVAQLRATRMDEEEDDGDAHGKAE